MGPRPQVGNAPAIPRQLGGPAKCHGGGWGGGAEQMLRTWPGGGAEAVLTCSGICSHNWSPPQSEGGKRLLGTRLLAGSPIQSADAAFARPTDASPLGLSLRLLLSLAAAGVFLGGPHSSPRRVTADAGRRMASPASPDPGLAVVCRWGDSQPLAPHRPPDEHSQTTSAWLGYCSTDRF